VLAGTLDVERAPLGACELPRGGHVDDRAGEAHHHHDAALHVGRVHEPLDRLDGAVVNVAAAGAVILLTGWLQADGVAALMVAALMVRSGWWLLRDASRVLLEGSPAGVRSETVGRALASAPGIVEVHDLHVWEVTSGFTALAAHVLVAPGDDCHARRRELEQLVSDRFGIHHTTLQVDHEARDELLRIE
jgi:cobalt-zinc-cadmium efflux system protein